MTQKQVWYTTRTVTTWHLFEDCPNRKGIDPKNKGTGMIEVDEYGLPIDEPDESSETCKTCLSEAEKDRLEKRQFRRNYSRD